MSFVILHHRFLGCLWLDAHSSGPSSHSEIRPCFAYSSLPEEEKQIQTPENGSDSKKNNETSRNIPPNEAAVAPNNTEDVARARAPGNNHVQRSLHVFPEQTFVVFSSQSSAPHSRYQATCSSRCQMAAGAASTGWEGKSTEWQKGSIFHYHSIPRHF